MYSPVRLAQVGGALSSHASAGALSTTTARAQQAIERYVPGRNAVLTDSGTTALTIAIAAAAQARFGSASRAASSEPRVALPAYACPDIATAAIANAARILLYDVDAVTLQPDRASVTRCLEQGVDVLVVTHLYGMLVDVPSALELAKRFGTVVVEDAAQSAGGTYMGRAAGSMASLGVMSFGRGKGINAGGGGALLYDAPLAETVSQLWAVATGTEASSGLSRISSLIHLGKVLAGELLSNPTLYGIPSAIPWLGIGETRFHPPARPRAIDLTSASLLPSALAQQPELIRGRRSVEAWYREQLSDTPQLFLGQIARLHESGALRTPVRLTPAIAMPLVKHGAVRSYPRTLADYREVAPWLSNDERLPGARELANHVHTLPTHAYVTDVDRNAIVRSLCEHRHARI